MAWRGGYQSPKPPGCGDFVQFVQDTSTQQDGSALPGSYMQDLVGSHQYSGGVLILKIYFAAGALHAYSLKTALFVAFI